MAIYVQGLLQLEIVCSLDQLKHYPLTVQHNSFAALAECLSPGWKERA